MNTTKEFYSTEEVAEHFGMSRDTVLGWIHSGRIHADEWSQPGGRRYRIRAAAVHRLETERTVKRGRITKRIPRGFKDLARAEADSLRRRMATLAMNEAE